MEYKLLSLVLTTAALSAFARALPAADPSPAEKSELRVLLVSHDPEAPKVPFPSMATERTYELYKERAAAFEAFLNEYFEHVRLVYGADYELAMSDEVDVTLFDARPPQLSAAKEVTDPETGNTSYQRASYLPESFDRPAVLISENAPLIGEPIGLKLDWL